MGSILVLGPMIISSILNQQASLAVNNISTLIDRSTNFNHVYVKTEQSMMVLNVMSARILLQH